MVVIKTKRCVLRPFEASDVKELQKKINDKEIARNTFTVPYPYTMKDARDWVKKNLKLQKLGQSKKRKNFRFVVEFKGNFAGGIDYNIDATNDKACEIGAWLAREYWNKGIMTECVKALVKYLFKKGFVRIYGYVYTFNKRSKRMIEKCGFKYEGTLRKHVKKKGKYYDDMVFAKVN